MLSRRPPVSLSEVEALTNYNSKTSSLTQQIRHNRGTSYCKSFRFQCGVCLCGLLMLVNVLYWNLLVPQPPLPLPSSLEPWQLPQTKVHAVLFFKEESHALVEVLLNLYSQGLDHVVMVDNMSEHPLPYDVIDLLRRKNFVTLWHDRHRMAQQKAYMKASQLARWKGADWLLAVDADEFPYATQLGSLQAYLTLRDPEVCSIAIPFRMFGSDKREEQPNSLVHGFVGRTNTTLKTLFRPAFKSVGRMGCTLWMAIHRAGHLPRFALRGYSAIGGFDRNDSPLIDGRFETITPDLVTNHYRYQSHRFYLDIKGTRGKSLAKSPERDEKSFWSRNYNHTLDYTLRDKVVARFPSLYGPIDDSLALRSNLNYTSPWPLNNVQAALQELERHQVLVIIDADNTLPDTLGIATRNAAILDPTLDCVVRVPPGHVESVIHSKLLELCKAVEAHPETQSWQDFVQAMVHVYQAHYKGFVAIPQHVRFPVGLETAPLRKAATMSAHWQPYDLTSDIRVQVCSSNAYVGAGDGKGKTK